MMLQFEARFACRRAMANDPSCGISPPADNIVTQEINTTLVFYRQRPVAPAQSFRFSSGALVDWLETSSGRVASASQRGLLCVLGGRRSGHVVVTAVVAIGV